MPKYYPVSTSDTPDHTLSSFGRPARLVTPHPKSKRSRPVRPEQVRSTSQQIRYAYQDPAAAQEDLDDDSEMWKMFLDEVKGEDSRFADAWKDDANSIVVFTGLFSAIVGAFIIEFYKTVSSNSSAANLPSPPGTAMIWVNALWLISLVLSLTCALIATLLQQWARRYIETPKFPNVLRHRARVRSLLLAGTKSYKIPIIVETLPTLLHLSVYLFLAGLVIAFHTINKTVAIAVDVAVGVSGLTYFALSILPCLDMKCPYRTPISQILWYPCRALLSFAAPFLHGCMLGLREPFNQPTQPGELPDSKNWQYLTYGLEKSIVYRAVETLRDGDRGRVTWLFNQLALGDRHTFLKFAASIPIYKIPELIPSIHSVSFRESLLVLLRSVAGTRPGLAAWLDSDVHKRSLLVCLHAICHIAKARAPTIPDLDFIRDHFADTSLMRALWDDDDNSIRIASRSICALVARQVVRKQRLEGEDLYWLQEVIGSSSNVILEADVTVRDQMNFKSFVRGVLSNHVSHLSIKDAISFNETLAILLGIKTEDHDYFTTLDWETRLSEEVGRIQRYDRRGGSEVFDRLRLMFPSLPRVTSAHAGIPPSHSMPPPIPVHHTPRETPPRHVAFLPHAPPSPRPVPRHAAPPPPPRAAPSPRPVPRHGRATPSPPPRAVYPPHSIRPSHRAHRHHAPM